MSTMIERLRQMMPGRDRPMDCHAVAQVLQRYLDGHLDERRVNLLEAHLDDCLKCGLELQTYEQIKRTLAQQRAPLPADSVARLREFGERLARGDAPADHTT